MKKALLILPVVAMLAAGCSSTQNVVENVNSSKETNTEVKNQSSLKTYTNTQYGFSFQYKPSWDPQDNIEFKKPLNGTEYVDIPGGAAAVYNSKTSSWEKKSNYVFADNIKAKTTPLGVKWYLAGFGDGGGGSLNAYIPDVANNVMVEVFVPFSSESANNPQSDLDQIMSTFKFEK